MAETRKLTDEEIDQIAEINEKQGIEILRMRTALGESEELVKTLTKMGKDTVKAVKVTENENKMLTTRTDMLEKQLARVSDILDHSVHILFSERFGEKELESDPAFKAFKYLRTAVDIQELGKPNSMAHDFKPEIMK